MPDAVVAALVVGPLAAFLTWLLNRRKYKDEHEASVASQWKEWAAEQGKRIDDLEADVAELKLALAEERRKTGKYARIVAALVRWALALRDEVMRLDGKVPAAPPEVEEALTSLEI